MSDYGDLVRKTIAEAGGREEYNVKGGKKNVKTGKWVQIDEFTQQRIISPTGGEVTYVDAWENNIGNIRNTYPNIEEYIEAAKKWNTEERKRKATSNTTNIETWYPSTWKQLGTLTENDGDLWSDNKKFQELGSFEKYVEFMEERWIQAYGAKDSKDSRGRAKWSSSGENKVQYPLAWRKKMRDRLDDPKFLGGNTLTQTTSSSTTSGMTGYGKAYGVANN